MSSQRYCYKKYGYKIKNFISEITVNIENYS